MISFDTFISRNFPQIEALDDDAYFVDEGALDSFAYIQLIASVENTFGCKIPDDDVTEENFGSKAAIKDYLNHRNLLV